MDTAAYENTRRATAGQLWSIAFSIWASGLVLESFMPGAFQASGGVAVAFTVLIFGRSLAKQSTYNLDIKLALIGLQKDANAGLGAPAWLQNTPEVSSRMKENIAARIKFEAAAKAHNLFTRQVINAESMIIFVSTLIASTGNFFLLAARRLATSQFGAL